MYLASLLNQHGALARTNSWVNQVGGQSPLASEIFSRMTKVILNLRDIDALKWQVMSEVELFSDQLVRDPTSNETRLVVSSAAVISIQLRIAPTISALRILQDNVHGLVRRTVGERGGLPRSISDAMKKLTKLRLPSDVTQLYQRYWTSTGSIVRDYRILDQHYSTIAAHPILVLGSEVSFLLLLPDDPSQKNEAKWRYKRGVDALELIRKGALELNEFAENLAEHFGHEPAPIQPSMRLSQLGDLSPFRERTLGLMINQQSRATKDGIELSYDALRFDHLNSGKIRIESLHPTPAKIEEANKSTKRRGPEA